MWSWCDDATMYGWMALGSLFWGIVVVAIIYLVGRPRPPRTDRNPASAAAARERPVAAGHGAAQISEEELKGLRDKLSG